MEIPDRNIQSLMLSLTQLEGQTLAMLEPINRERERLRALIDLKNGKADELSRYRE